MGWGETPAATSIFRMIIAFPSFILKEPVTVLEGTSETLAPTSGLDGLEKRAARGDFVRKLHRFCRDLHSGSVVRFHVFIQDLDELRDNPFALQRGEEAAIDIDRRLGFFERPGQRDT